MLQIESEADDIYVLRISGVLKQSEFSAEQSALSNKIDAGSRPRLLVILENFEGWERGADWGTISISFFCIAEKFPRLPSSPNPVGRRLRLLEQQFGPRP
jgi:hypothetical protein